MQKIHLQKGSILIGSLLIMFIMASITIALLFRDKEDVLMATSLESGNRAYQIADQGLEIVMADIVKGGHTKVNQLNNCNNVTSLIEDLTTGYSIELQDATGSKINCNTGGDISTIDTIKSTGTDLGKTRRTIVAKVPPPATACGSTISDVDGNVYNTIKIGTQCWMKENMMTTKYPDGTSITRGPTNATWDTTDHAYYAYPPNVTNTAEETLANIKSGNLGFIYQWSAAMHGSTTAGAQGICPTGWHIPTHDEFTTLERAVCTSGTCVTDFPFDTTTTQWRGTNEGSKLSTETSGGTNSSGFSAHLIGFRDALGSFFDRSSNTTFWSSIQSGGNAWYRYLNSGHTSVYRGTQTKADGFSVRCVKN